MSDDKGYTDLLLELLNGDHPECEDTKDLLEAAIAQCFNDDQDKACSALVSEAISSEEGMTEPEFMNFTRSWAEAQLENTGPDTSPHVADIENL